MKKINLLRSDYMRLISQDGRVDLPYEQVGRAW